MCTIEIVPGRKTIQRGSGSAGEVEGGEKEGKSKRTTKPSWNNNHHRTLIVSKQADRLAGKQSDNQTDRQPVGRK